MASDHTCKMLALLQPNLLAPEAWQGVSPQSGWEADAAEWALRPLPLYLMLSPKPGGSGDISWRKAGDFLSALISPKASIRTMTAKGGVWLARSWQSRVHGGAVQRKKRERLKILICMSLFLSLYKIGYSSGVL